MRRQIEPEELDGVPPEEAAQNLRDLVRINRWLGGHWLMTRLVGEVARRGERFTLLDVGAASGDMGRAVQRRFPGVRVVAADRMARNLAGAAPPKVVADAFALPFAGGAFDVVAASLFLHHFTEAEAVVLLREMGRVARRAVIILDLWRHPVAAAFLPATRGLFGWHRVTVEDGVRSVRAGFLAGELRQLGEEAGLGAVRVRRHLPWFRVSLVGRVDGAGKLLI